MQGTLPIAVSLQESYFVLDARSCFDLRLWVLYFIREFASLPFDSPCRRQCQLHRVVKPSRTHCTVVVTCIFGIEPCLFCCIYSVQGSQFGQFFSFLPGQQLVLLLLVRLAGIMLNISKPFVLIDALIRSDFFQLFTSSLHLFREILPVPTNTHFPNKPGDCEKRTHVGRKAKPEPISIAEYLLV